MSQDVRVQISPAPPFYAVVMELVDVTDSNSVGSDIVRVQVPPAAPVITEEIESITVSMLVVRARHRK